MWRADIFDMICLVGMTDIIHQDRYAQYYPGTLQDQYTRHDVFNLHDIYRPLG